MKIRYQDGEWWKFADDGEGINPVKIIDIDNRPLTDETLEELGFEYIPLPFNSSFRIGSSFIHRKYNFFYIPTKGNEVIKYVQFLPTGIKYKTVGGIKLLLEALKGDE